MAPPSSNAPRSFLPPINSEPFFVNGMLPASDTSHFGSHNQRSSTNDADSPPTPAKRAPAGGSGGGGFDFVPTMNFDDFQSSIVDPHWSSPLLAEFPSHSGTGRALPKEPTNHSMPRSSGYAAMEGGGGGWKQRPQRQQEAVADRGGRPVRPQPLPAARPLRGPVPPQY